MECHPAHDRGEVSSVEIEVPFSRTVEIEVSFSTTVEREDVTSNTMASWLRRIQMKSIPPKKPLPNIETLPGILERGEGPR